MSAFYCLDTLETKCVEIREKKQKKSRIKSLKKGQKKRLPCTRQSLGNLFLIQNAEL